MSIGLTEGSLCVDPSPGGVAQFTGTYKITGGTGRFKGASGVLTLNSTLSVALFSASNAPALLMNVGEFTGQISRVAIGDEAQNQGQ